MEIELIWQNLQPRQIEDLEILTADGGELGGLVGPCLAVVEAFYLLEDCFARLLRAEVCRPVQGNLFPCSSVTLGSGTTTQIP